MIAVALILVAGFGFTGTVRALKPAAWLILVMGLAVLALSFLV